MCLRSRLLHLHKNMSNGESSRTWEGWWCRALQKEKDGESLAVNIRLLFLVKQQSMSDERKSLSVKSQISRSSVPGFPALSTTAGARLCKKPDPIRSLQQGWLGLPGDVSGQIREGDEGPTFVALV